MTSAPTSIFTASDGRPFEVHWASEANSLESWHWNDAHTPKPMTPLYEWVMQHPPGRLHAYAEAGIDAPHMFRGFEVHHGFQYVRQSPLRAEEMAQFVAKSRALAARYGGACNVFERFALSRIQAACQKLQESPSATPVAALSQTFNYAFHISHVAGPAMFQPLQAKLVALLEGKFPPPQVLLLAQEVGQGAESATVESDLAIARMAALASTNPALTAAVTGPAEDALAKIESTAGGDEFRSQLSAYIAAHGCRAETWGIETPTLSERPEFLIGMIRQAMHAPLDRNALRAGALAVRQAAIRRIETALSDDPGAIAAVRSIAEELGDYVFVREGRAQWQLRAGGSLRLALLRKGKALVAAGAIEQPEDILYLLPEEIDPFFEREAASANLRSLVAERKALRNSRMAFTPPRIISANPAMLGPEPGRDPAPDNVLKGAPASRGSATARARVVLELADSDELEPGEVLVCVMTSPPWTPLFGVASAIVADSGGALSHSAIAAREYGIPAVVGTNDATRRIRTGDLITVDGTAGTVLIHGP